MLKDVILKVLKDVIFMKDFGMLTKKLFDGLDEVGNVGDIRNADTNRSVLLKEELSSLVTQFKNRIRELESRKLDGPPTSRCMPLYISVFTKQECGIEPTHNYHRLIQFLGGCTMEGIEQSEEV